MENFLEKICYGGKKLLYLYVIYIIMEKNNTIIHNKKYLDYPSFFRIFVSQIKLYALNKR
jgi:hypothetical protein